MLKKKGDITKPLKKTEDFLEKEIQKLGEELAQEFQALLRQNIMNNKFGFTLSEKTLMRKVNKSAPPLMDSGDFVRNIIAEGTTVKMTNGTHKSGLSFAELSDILEYGRKDKSVPAFPVWRLTYEEFLPQAQNKIQKRLKSFINKK